MRGGGIDGLEDGWGALGGEREKGFDDDDVPANNFLFMAEIRELGNISSYVQIFFSQKSR